MKFPHDTHASLVLRHGTRKCSFKPVSVKNLLTGDDSTKVAESPLKHMSNAEMRTPKFERSHSTLYGNRLEHNTPLLRSPSLPSLFEHQESHKPQSVASILMSSSKTSVTSNGVGNRFHELSHLSKKNACVSARTPLQSIFNPEPRHEEQPGSKRGLTFSSNAMKCDKENSDHKQLLSELLYSPPPLQPKISLVKVDHKPALPVLTYIHKEPSPKEKSSQWKNDLLKEMFEDSTLIVRTSSKVVTNSSNPAKVLFAETPSKDVGFNLEPFSRNLLEEMRNKHIQTPNFERQQKPTTLLEESLQNNGSLLSNNELIVPQIQLASKNISPYNENDFKQPKKISPCMEKDKIKKPSPTFNCDYKQLHQSSQNVVRDLSNPMSNSQAKQVSHDLQQLQNPLQPSSADQNLKQASTWNGLGLNHHSNHRISHGAYQITGNVQPLATQHNEAMEAEVNIKHLSLDHQPSTQSDNGSKKSFAKSYQPQTDSGHNQPLHQNEQPFPNQSQQAFNHATVAVKGFSQIHNQRASQPQTSNYDINLPLPPPPTRIQPPKATQAENVPTIVVNGVRYFVGEKLGRGGSSTVYKVCKEDDTQPLAIKCVDLKSVDDAIRTSYLNEITLLQRMQGNSKVIQLLDFELNADREVLYVVMEKGAKDLANFIKERAKCKDHLHLPTIIGFWTDMLEAVKCIHEKGIIHSDLKPANFLLVGEVGYQLKLIDFGIASSLQNDMTSVVRDTPAGTLNYMSPESVRGMQGQPCPVKINYKSDVWSLGCILYNLMYGRTPFQQVTHPALKAEAICNPRHEIEFPSNFSDGLPVPPILLRVVQSCLNREPSMRPNVTQLLEAKYCGCEDHEARFVESLATIIQSLPASTSSRLLALLEKNKVKGKDGK